MKSDKAIILSMNTGDSLFFLKDSGVRLQRINDGILSDKIIMWIDKDRIKTKDSVIAYLFAEGGDDYGYVVLFGPKHDDMMVLFKSTMGPTVSIRANYMFTYNEIQKMSDKWEHYIFISKEEKK